MSHLWDRLLDKARTLKVNILFLFLSLFAAIFFAVLSFTYIKGHRLLARYSDEIASENIAIILAKFQAMTSASEWIMKTSIDFFPSLGPLTVQNKALIAYMFNLVKYDPDFTNYAIGLPNGNLIAANKKGYAGEEAFITDPTKNLPPETKFVLRFLDASHVPAIDNWTYLDGNFQEVARESFSTLHYDTLKRPWYIGAVAAKQLLWMGPFLLQPQEVQGVAIANPLYDANGELTAVLEADVSFLQLSDFLRSQQIGKTGKAFILDEKGEIILPDAPYHEEAILPAVISQAYAQFTKTPSNADYVIKNGSKEFVCFVAKLPVISSLKWYIVTAAPVEDFFGELSRMQMENMGIIVAIMIGAGWVVFFFARRISSPIVTLADEVDKISQLDLESRARVHTNIKEIYLIDSAIAAMRRVIRSFARYVPTEIVRDLFKEKEGIVLGGESREMTIFFSDIADFTSIAETHSIDELVPWLTSYFDAMSKVIVGSGGTIDKFLGDGIMAFWGAPIATIDHAPQASLAALRCLAMLKELNAERRAASLPEFQTRFGVNTGGVIVGNIGTEERMNYTAVGDVVNMAAQLQEIDKTYHTSIILGEETAKKLGPEFVVRPLGEVSVKSKNRKMQIFELMGVNGKDLEIQPTQEQILLCQGFREAYAAMLSGNLHLAHQLFASLATQFPQDYPTQMYEQRLHPK